MHQKHFFYYSIKEVGKGGDDHNFTGTNRLLNTMDHSIKKALVFRVDLCRFVLYKYKQNKKYIKKNV